MQQICELICDLAETDSTVLIHGETGTGKEMIAKAIHYNSSRSEQPLVGFNCAALSETLLESELFGHEKGAFTGAIKMRLGRFEQANGGTVFLDEIGDVPLMTQVKLLRILQEREFERVGGNETIKVDVRIISATNVDLQGVIKTGKFREDLFYRLNVMLIEIPPLRERLDDVPILAIHFLKEYAERFKKKIEEIEQDAIQFLLNHRWPGNVRELQNVMERGVILEKSKALTKQTLIRCLQPSEKGNLQFFLNENISYRQAKQDLIERFERDYLIRLLEKYKGNITNAAKSAQLDYKNFHSKMKKHDISKWEFKD